jgi:four helix bundle protein
MIRFLQIALGSAGELEYELLLARDLAYLSESDYTTLVDSVVEVGRMLSVFVRRLKDQS